MKNKKPLWITLFALDGAIVIFYFVIHIMMLANTIGKTPEQIRAEATGLIGYLQLHTTFYLLVFVIPLFVILIANIVGLVIYVKKQSAKKQVALDDLSDEDKKKLLEQIAGDLNKDK